MYENIDKKADLGYNFHNTINKLQEKFLMNINGISVVFSFVVAFIIAFAATPFVKKFAFKIGAVDVPKDNRRMHRKPMALLGGLAIFLGFLISVLCFADFFLPSGAINKGLIGILLSSIIIVILGIFDDLKPLSAKFKFVIQILAAAIPVLLDVRVFAISNPFSPDQLIRLPEWISITFSIFWIVGVTNAVNLIDGLDGLAAGVSSIASVALLSILLLQHNVTGSLVVLAAALAGACFGFLPYNFNPAKIFMGDTGSLFLGAMVVGSAFVLDDPAIILVLGIIYVAESLSVIIQVASFKLTGKRVFKMSPIHHHFEKCGWSEVKIVSVFSLVTLVFSAAAVILTYLTTV